jgi:PAS domain S-box-containing protein
MSNEIEFPISLQRIKSLSLGLVLFFCALLGVFSFLGAPALGMQTVLHLKTALIWLCLFTAGVLLLKGWFYRLYTQESLALILGTILFLNTGMFLTNAEFPYLFPALRPAPLSMGIWIFSDALISIFAFTALGWFSLQKPKKRSQNLYLGLGFGALLLGLIYLSWLFIFPAVSSPAWDNHQPYLFLIPAVIWLLTQLLILRRWPQFEPPFFTFFIGLSLVPRLEAYALEGFFAPVHPYLPSATFFMLMAMSLSLLLIGLMLNFIQGNTIKMKIGEYFKHSQKELADHTRQIELANQDLENQIVRQQIQADLSRLLTLSLNNAPVKEMLNQMMTYLTALPWLALTGSWALYIYDSKSGDLHLRYLNSPPPEWPAKFSDLAMPNCLCGHARTSEEFTVCTRSFAELTESSMKTIHYGLLLQTASSQPIGRLILFATPGSSADLPVLEFLKSVAQIFTGVIQRKQIEEELRQERDKINQYLANAGVIFMILSTDRKIQMVNRKACEVLGYQPFELIGKDWFELCVPERARLETTEFFNSILELGQKDTDYAFENPVLNHDGQERWVAWHSTILKNSDDTIQAILASGEDITEQKNLQSQLLQSQKLESIGQLAAGIAHEINTPTQYVGDNVRFMQESFQKFATLISQFPDFIEAVKRNNFSPEMIIEMESAVKEADFDYLSEEIPRAIDQSLEGIGRVATIVRAMKEFAHPDTAEKTLTDLNHAIECTITISRNEWKYVAEIETYLDPELPMVPCLPGEFNQVLLNMIVNASHAIADVVGGEGQAEKGKIRFRTRLGKDRAEIYIEDTGTGIPKDILPKIFDPFFTTKKIGKGTGQGLAISRNVVVEKLKGSIDVQSQVGKGTTFIIRLPLMDDQPAAGNPKGA